MWRELVSGLFEDAEFTEPASPSAIEAVEAEFQLALPEELKELLRESNGVSANYGAGLVWPIEQMSQQNRVFRETVDFAELYMPFDGLFFFGEEGNGDQFGYRVLGGQIRDTSWVFEWDHESDNRQWFAGSLKEFLEKAAQSEE